MLRVYLDNMIVSGRVTKDLGPEENAAVQKIERANGVILKRVTSRHAWREQDDTPDDALRARFTDARVEVSVVSRDNVLEGFNPPIKAPGGTFSVNPIFSEITNEDLYAYLKSIGIKDKDAKHVMYAAESENDCVRFLTLDKKILNKKTAIEARCPSLRIMKPTELVAELGL